jgi:L-asparaginase
MTLRILATGGTFDKHYDEIAGKLTFTDSHLPAILNRCRITHPIRLDIIGLLDSLDMRDADRITIATACEQAPETAIIIIHGTDTMRETAALLGRLKLAKTIVLTGAMIPYEITNSDALFNLGMACGVAQTLPHGVYITMNGQIFNWDKVKKNRTAGIFVA